MNIKNILNHHLVSQWLRMEQVFEIRLDENLEEKKPFEMIRITLK